MILNAYSHDLEKPLNQAMPIKDPRLKPFLKAYDGQQATFLYHLCSDEGFNPDHTVTLASDKVSMACVNAWAVPLSFPATLVSPDSHHLGSLNAALKLMATEFTPAGFLRADDLKQALKLLQPGIRRDKAAALKRGGKARSLYRIEVDPSRKGGPCPHQTPEPHVSLGLSGCEGVDKKFCINHLTAKQILSAFPQGTIHVDYSPLASQPETRVKHPVPLVRLHQGEPDKFSVIVSTMSLLPRTVSYAGGGTTTYY